MVLLVHIVYYPVYEYGPRYAVATGESLLEGYRRTPVGRGFLWITLAFMFVTPPLILGSTGKLSSDVLHAAFQSTFPDMTTNDWSTILFPFTLVLILFGKYKRLEIFSKFMILVIVVTAVAAFATEPPPVGEFAKGLRPSIPTAVGAMVVVTAMLRVPTHPAASIFVSEWAKEKRENWIKGSGGQEEEEALLTSLRNSIFDMRVGFTISCLVGIILLSLGATVLKPRGLTLAQGQVSFELASMYTETLGQWVFPIFIVASFAAFWGSMVGAADGMLRLFRGMVKMLFRLPEMPSDRVGKFYLAGIMTAGYLIATRFERPMTLVLITVMMGLLFYPLTFALNTYCVTRLVPEAFRPSKANLALAFAGFIVSMVGVVLLVLQVIRAIVEATGS